MAPSPGTLRVRTALVCALVVLSGCQFPVSGEPTTTSREPFGVPETTTAPDTATTTTPSGVDVPGLSRDGVTDPNALASAHRASLRGHNYTLATNHTERYANGTLRTSRRNSVAFGADRDEFLLRTAVEGSVSAFLDVPRGSFSVWSNGSASFLRIIQGNDTSYSRWRSRLPVRRQYDRFLTLFSAVETDLAGTVTYDGSGGTVYRVTSTRARYPMDVAAIDGLSRRSGTVESVENVSLVAWVDDTGTVRRYRLRYVATVRWEGHTERIQVTESARVTAVGSTTVVRPGWVSAALNRTGGGQRSP